MPRQLVVAGAIAITLAIAAISSLATVHATDRTCSLSSLTGPDAVYGQGNVFVGSTQAVEEVDVGELTYDGKGSFTGFSTFSLNGTLVRTRFSGTYMVNADCTTSAIVKDDVGETLHQEGVVLGTGNEVRFIETEPGAAIARVARRLDYECVR